MPEAPAPPTRLVARAGTPFEVVLASASGGGYLWELVPPPAGVRLVASRMDPPSGSAIGDAATQVFTLQADAAGLVRLAFVLKRRWEADAIETREVQVDVR